jgi:hypothetical protein
MSNQLHAIKKILASTIHPERPLRSALAGLNKNQALSLQGEIYAELYWAKRNPEWFKDESRKYFASIRRVYRWVANRLKKGAFLPERNQNGLIVERSHWIGTIEQFEARLCRTNKWVNYHSRDYSSFWGCVSELKLISYIEGDVVTLTATNIEQWDDELADQRSWYADNA